MKLTKWIVMAAVIGMVSLPAARAVDYEVSATAVCSVLEVDASFKEKLVKEKLVTDQLVAKLLDVAGLTEVNPAEVTLVYEADFGYLRIVRKCDGGEELLVAYSYCVEAYNETSSAEKVQRMCLLEMLVEDLLGFNGLYGTALGKEKATYGDTSEKFKASYNGQAFTYTFIDDTVCTIKLKTGAEFIPTGGCP